MSGLAYDPKVAIKLDDDEIDAIKELLKMAEGEDKYVRYIQLREAKKLDQYWAGFQYLFLDSNNDWKIPTHEVLQSLGTGEEAKVLYDFVINMFTAHGESIIAALAADLPYVRFAPENAENSTDLRASKAATIRSKEIEEYNRARELFLHTLFFCFTSQLIAAHHYTNSDESYGTDTIPKYGKVKQQTTPDVYQCNGCGYATEDVNETLPAQQTNLGANDISLRGGEFNEPSSEETGETQEQEAGEQTQDNQSSNPSCPQCQQQLEKVPGLMEDVPDKIGEDKIPKNREIIEIHSLMNVKVPSYAKDQKACGYIIKYIDEHFSYAKEYFKDVKDSEGNDIADKIGPGQSVDDYERIMRTPTTSFSTYNQERTNIVTIKVAFFRPKFINSLSSNQKGSTGKDVIKSLRKKFPLGIYAAFVGDDIFCDSRNIDLDDEWDITKPKLSRHVHAQPLGSALVSIQDIKNQIANLKMQTMEQAIPQTIADPDYLNFDEYANSENSPGLIFPGKAPVGHALGDGFFTFQATTLSREVTAIEKQNDEDAEFVSGDVPSIYGGSGEGSKTLGEYQASRQASLQRLGITWQLLSCWWSDILFKCVKRSFKNQLTDSSFSVKGNGGSYQNLWVRKADTEGSFKTLEPEVGTDFPVAFAQKRSTVMQLLQLNSDSVNKVLEEPDNAESTVRIAGLGDDFKIPGALQADKQLREISQLILGTPSPDIDPQTNQEILKCSVPTEPDIDDAEAHIVTLVNYLISDAGQDLKDNKPDAYKNCILHKLMHDKDIANKQMQMQQQQIQAQGAVAPQQGAQ